MKQTPKYLYQFVVSCNVHIDLLGLEQRVLLIRFCFWREDEGGKKRRGNLVKCTMDLMT